MKWTKRSWSRGDTRVNSGFILLPKIVLIEVKGIEYWDIRWLEHATWREKFYSDMEGGRWDTIEFLEDYNGT